MSALCLSLPLSLYVFLMSVKVTKKMCVISQSASAVGTLGHIAFREVENRPIDFGGESFSLH